MYSVKEFIEVFYEDYPILEDDITLKEFQSYKEENGIEEWDYPIEEYEHIADLHKENGTDFVPVKFERDEYDYGDEYDYRFCEVPTKIEEAEM